MADSSTPLLDSVLADSTPAAETAGPVAPAAPASTPLLDSVLAEHKAAPAPAPFVSKINPPVNLNLKPASPLAEAHPPVNWEGITPHILQKANDLEAIKDTKDELGLSPDIYPENHLPHFGAVVKQFVDDHRAEIDANQKADLEDQTGLTSMVPGLAGAKKAYRDASFAKRNYLDPVLKSSFEHAMGEGEDEPVTGAALPIFRAMGQTVAGREQFQKHMANDPEMSKGINQIFDAVGDKGTKAILTAADMTGQAPLFIVGGSGSLIEAGVNGAAMSLAIPDMSIGEGALGGAALHAAGTVVGRIFANAKDLVVEGAGKLKKSIFGAEPSAEAWAKVKPIKPEAETRLIAVFTRKGLDETVDALAKAEPTRFDPPRLPAGPDKPAWVRPQMAVAHIDANGQPIVKTTHVDPSVPGGEIIRQYPLDLKTAQQIGQRVPMVEMTKQFRQRWELGDFTDIGNAFYNVQPGAGGNGQLIPTKQTLTPDLLADFDYKASHFPAQGAEARIVNGVPQITPVFGDVRLPDEIPPPEELATPNGVGTNAGRRAPFEATVINPNTTQMMDQSDMAKIGNPNLKMVGGGAGKPPSPPIKTWNPSDEPTAPDEEGGPNVPSATAGSRSKLGEWNPPDRAALPSSGEEQKPPSTDVKSIFKTERDVVKTGRLSVKQPTSPDETYGEEYLRIQGPDVPEKTTTPQGPPSPANVTPETMASLQNVMKSYRTLQTDKTGVDKALALIAGRHLRGPVDLSTTVTSIQAANQLAKMSDDIRTRLDAYYPKGLLDQSNLDLHNYMEGKLTDSEFFAKYPDLSKKAQEFSRDLFEEKQYWDKFFQSKGVVPEQLGEDRRNGIVPLYTARRFWAHLLPPGAWAKKSMEPARMDVMWKGVDRILKDMQAMSDKVPYVQTKGNVTSTSYLPTVTNDEVAMEVRRIMNAEDPIAAFKSANIGKPYSSLMAKNRALPPEVLDMLGEVRSGTVSTAITIGMQRANAARYSLMEEVAANPEWASVRPDVAHGLTYPLPEHPSMFKASGLYTNQAIWEALGNGPQITDSSHQILQVIQRIIKGHQVVGGFVGPHLNSLIDNLKGGILAGGLDLTRPHKGSPYMYRAARALIDYKGDPTGLTGFGGHVLDAKRNGADYFGFGHEEINNPASLKFHKDINAAYPDPSGNILQRTGDLMLRSMKGYERGLAWLGGGLDWVDRLFRMQSYIALQDKYLADLAKNGANSYLMKAGLISGRLDSAMGAASEVRTMKFNPVTREELNSVQRMVHEAAGQLASRRVNQSFWNPTFVGTGVEKLRKSAVGVVTPYATAFFENWRVSGQVLNRIHSGEEPDLKWRLLTSIMAMGGAAGMLKACSGVSDKEIQEAQAEMPDSASTFKPATFALPWHDSKGRVQFWNYSSWFELTRLMQGDQQDPMLNRVLTNLVMSPLQGGLAEAPVRRAFEMAGAVSSVGKPNQPVGVTQSGAMSLLQYLHGAGAFPTVLGQIGNAMRRTDIGTDGDPQYLGPTVGKYIPPLGDLIGQPKPYEESLTPMEGFMKGTGMTNAEPVTSGDTDYTKRANPSRSGSEIEANAEIGKKGSLVKEVKKIFGSQKSDTSKQDDNAEMQAEYAKRTERYQQKISKRKK